MGDKESEIWGSARPIEVRRQLLAELIAAHGKSLLFKVAFALLVVSLIGGGIVAYVR